MDKFGQRELEEAGAAVDCVMIRLRPFASGERYFGTRLRFVSFAACFGPRRTQTNDRLQSFAEEFLLL
jgi:hypothetical protein